MRRWPSRDGVWNQAGPIARLDSDTRTLRVLDVRSYSPYQCDCLTSERLVIGEDDRIRTARSSTYMIARNDDDVHRPALKLGEERVKWSS